MTEGPEGKMLRPQEPERSGLFVEPRVKDLSAGHYIDTWNKNFGSEAMIPRGTLDRIASDTGRDIQPVEKLENSLLSYLRRVYAGKFSNEELYERLMALRKLLPGENGH